MSESESLKELPGFVTLSGIGYSVTVREGLIIFEESHCMSGFHTRIAFERTDYKGGGCWYVQFDNTSGTVVASHIVEAYKLVCDVYGGPFEEKRPL